LTARALTGNLGDGEKKDRDAPIMIKIECPPVINVNPLLGPPPTVYRKIAQVVCGSRHCVALCEDGDVYS